MAAIRSRVKKRWLRTKIVLSLLIVGLIPVLFGLFITYWNGTLKLRESMGENFKGLAMQASQKTDLVIEREVDSKKHLATTIEIKRAIEKSNLETNPISKPQKTKNLTELETLWEKGDPSLREEILHNDSSRYLRKYMMTKKEKYIAFFLTNEQGTLVASVNALTDFTHGEKPWWKKAYNDGIGRTYIGDLYFNEKAQVWAINVAVPVIDDQKQKVSGILAVFHEIRELLGPPILDIRFGESGHAMLIDSQGRVLICPIMPTGKPLNEGLVSKITSPMPNWVLADDDSHEMKVEKNSIIGFAPVVKTSEITRTSTGMTWHSFIREKSEELYAPINSLLQSVALSGIALIVFVAIMGIFLSKKLARPIQLLHDGAEKIASGNLDVRLDIRTNDEIEQLANEFNNMAAKLKESYSNLEQKVEQRTQQLSALNLISTTTNRTLELQTILEETLDKVLEVMGFQAGALRLRDEKTDKLVLRVARGLPSEVIEKYQEISMGEMFAGKTAIEGQPVVVEDLQKTPQSEGPFQSMGMVTVVAIPLKSKDRVLGTLTGASQTHRSFSSQDMELLSSIGSQLGIAIENATLFIRTKAMVEQLQEVDRFKTEFFSNISHQLRTPMTSIIGNSEFLLTGKSGDLNPKQNECIESIQESGRLLLDEINNLLDLSRIKAGKMEIKFGEFSVEKLVKKCRITVAPLAAKKNQKIEFHLKTQGEDYQFEDGELMINADQTKVQQILLNLLSNAIKFTPKNGLISIQASSCLLKGEPAIEISVMDNGKGIRKEDQEKIFDDFKQLDSSDAREQTGSGLGLPIAKKYIEMHGGRIFVDSQFGRGSNFTFILPKRIASEEKLHIKALELEATEVFPPKQRVHPTDPKEDSKEGWVDPLTGLFNEKYLEDFLHRNEFKTKEGGEPLALVFTRIRHFKNFNERRGKDAGDEAIKGLARIFQDNLKGRDLLCRCYGSTFGIMLDGTDKDRAIKVGKKLKNLVEKSHSGSKGNKGKEPLFLNVVVSSYPNEFLTPHSILSQGVQALNESERKGGDAITTL